MDGNLNNGGMHVKMIWKAKMSKEKTEISLTSINFFAN